MTIIFMRFIVVVVVVVVVEDSFRFGKHTGLEKKKSVTEELPP